jgi:TIR domain
MVSPVEIFCCYSRKDQPLLNELKAHLMPLQRQGLVKIWADTDISAGTEWEKEIEKHLDTAQIILLLVSPDFINSDYCYSKEMKRAIERHERGEARVIPVILRHVYWQGLFGNFQALPKDALPITDPNWHNLDRALFNVAEGIRKVVEELVISGQNNLVTSTTFPNPRTTNDHHLGDFYREYWSRKHPGLVIILLDQLSSMAIRGERNPATLAERSAAIVNVGYGLGLPCPGQRRVQAGLALPWST